LIETVKQCGELAPSQIIARVMQAADGFVAGAKQQAKQPLVSEFTESFLNHRFGG
jgi:hypothetical protein